MTERFVFKSDSANSRNSCSCWQHDLGGRPRTRTDWYLLDSPSLGESGASLGDPRDRIGGGYSQEAFLGG